MRGLHSEVHENEEMFRFNSPNKGFPLNPYDENMAKSGHIIK